jgi:hypothetical protein
MAFLSFPFVERILRFTLNLPKQTVFRWYNNVPSIRTVNGDFDPVRMSSDIMQLEHDGFLVLIISNFSSNYEDSDVSGRFDLPKRSIESKFRPLRMTQWWNMDFCRVEIWLIISNSEQDETDLLQSMISNFVHSFSYRI